MLTSPTGAGALSALSHVETKSLLGTTTGSLELPVRVVSVFSFRFLGMSEVEFAPS